MVSVQFSSVAKDSPECMKRGTQDVVNTGVLLIERFHRLRNNVTGFTSTRVEHREITGVQLAYGEDGSG